MIEQVSGLFADALSLRHPRADREALRGVTLEVRRGELLAIVGPNGSGKSTLLAGLARQLVARSGGVRLEDRPAAELSSRAFARRVGRLPQAPEAPEGLTVERLVACGRTAHRRAFSGPSREDADAISEAIEWTDLSSLRRRTIETLSGGERRRAWLAMVLAQRAVYLLLDEPLAALDLRAAAEIWELLQRIPRERGTGVAVVLHDLDRATVADRVAVILRGRLYATGPPRALFDTDLLRDVFGVDGSFHWTDRGAAVRVLGPADALRHL
ncbi:MAG TPA: ABC transporter ATP-binding protein [Thermoanaerobaculia bacterium]|jgi:iron complex transport system ATP-binding protein|nr:ABC transporter ATP-binding protein [Thermoanaerobaculia bacterium]